MTTTNAADFPTRIITDMQRDGTLFWNNEQGWVEHESDATRFTLDEMRTLYLPMGECVAWSLPSNWLDQFKRA